MNVTGPPGRDLVVEPDVHRDGRGFFLERFSRERYADAGIDVDFVQDNQARSRRGTVRGLHFQVAPGQPKLVSVTRGAIFDVVVDIRPASSSFGEWESFHLDDEHLLQVFVPAGFAHGYCALSDEADVSYKVGTYYDAAAERVSPGTTHRSASSGLSTTRRYRPGMPATLACPRLPTTCSRPSVHRCPRLRR